MPKIMPDEYQAKSMRTLCDQEAALARLSISTNVVQANHALIGLSGEVGELATFWQKLVYYGKQMSPEEVRDKIKDEAGDVLWYVAELLSAFGLLMSEVMEANIRKLAVRYPEKYTDERAEEGNRDRIAEEKAIRARLEPVQPSHYHDWSVNGDAIVCGKCGLTIRKGETAKGLCSGIPMREKPPIANLPCADGVHDWMLLQGPAGSGRKCKRCGQVEGF